VTNYYLKYKRKVAHFTTKKGKKN